jgi:hypothetical protein
MVKRKRKERRIVVSLKNTSILEYLRMENKN